MTKPEKQDGTMELDVGQIDLLDLQLPPRSQPELERSDEPRGSKGPPPLPPSLPPAEAPPEEPPVPSLVLPEPSKPRITPAPPVSARKLVGAGPEEKSPAVRFMLGMGAATIVCVLTYVGFRTLHKTPAAQAPAPSASVAPTPTHAFTMAPIEFTEPASSQEPAPSAHASAAPPPSSTAAAATATATHAPAATSHATPTTTTGAKPPRTDELIKVEN